MTYAQALNIVHGGTFLIAILIVLLVWMYIWFKIADAITEHRPTNTIHFVIFMTGLFSPVIGLFLYAVYKVIGG